MTNDIERKLATLETQIAENRRLLRHLTRLVEQLVDPAPQPKPRRSLADATRAITNGTRHSTGTGRIPPIRPDERPPAKPESALAHLAEARQILRRNRDD